MRYKQLQLSILLFLGVGLTGLQAQTMYVKQSNGTQTTYTLDNVRKMTFSSGEVAIHKSDNSIGAYALSELTYLSFTDYETGISEPAFSITEYLHIYPNPVEDVLNVDLSLVDNAHGTLSILSIDGRLLYSQQINESSMVTISMSQFTQSFYLCRYSSSKEIRTVKIIKQ